MHADAVCPACGTPCSTGSEQIRWNEKSGSEQIRWNELTGFERAEIIGRGDDRAEIIGRHGTGNAGNFVRQDVVGNYQEIVGNRDIVGGGGPGHFSRDFIVGAEGDPVTPGTSQALTPTPGAPAPVAATPPTGTPAFHKDKSMIQQAWEVIGMISTPALIYHGYKRNDDSVWGALGWGVLSVVWPITLPIALAQGFGKPSAEARFKQAARA
jgi:hypothetical protein